MDNIITGKTLKTLAKKVQSVVYRVDGAYQTIECKNDDGIINSFNIKTGFDAGKHTFVEMFANQHDTTFQYFLKSLKPADEIIFYVRNNGSTLLKEAGLTCNELRVRVTSRKPDGTLKDVKEMTLMRENRKL